MNDSRDADRATLNGQRAVETVRRLLADLKLQPLERPLPGGLALLVAIDGPADQGVAQVFVGDERFVFHFVFPGYVDPTRRPQVAEFIARANWSLIEGNFELDFRTGAFRYKVGIDFTHAELVEPLVRNAILSGMDNIEMFAGALELVRTGVLEPEAAYRQATANATVP